MENETSEKKTCGMGCKCGSKKWKHGGCGGGGGLYAFGFFGAAYYYITTTTGLAAGAVGFLKALVWPAFLVYEVLKSLGV
ncbi:MAG: hypothetical protein O2794_01370 [bacterium]|nr:hypothetical protein [bacterium]